MIACNIMSTIFQDTPEGTLLAREYSIGAQEEFGLEWLGRHNRAIALHLAYLRIAQSAPVACLTLNEIISDYLEGEDVDYPYTEEDMITVDVVRALYGMLDRDSYVEEFIVGRLIDAIRDETMDADADNLIPLEDL